MNKNIGFAFLISIVGSVSLFAFFKKEKDIDTPQRLSEKINLALRQTAHYLLKEEGDSTSRIIPVENLQGNTFLIRLEHSFKYDSLPAFLNRSLAQHHILSNYDVSVWDCSQKTLVLGYTSLDFSQNNSVACSGRDMPSGCYNIKVTFSDLNTQASSFSFFHIFLIGLVAAAIPVFSYFFYKNKGENVEKEENPISDAHLINIGNSILNMQNQIVSSGNIQQNLTYREAKLLHLFCQHKNELLDRDLILKEVWEDEGILVGRSLDVFVSRLRKLLKHDESLKITTIHGRGYKFEVLEKV